VNCSASKRYPRTSYYWLGWVTVIFAFATVRFVVIPRLATVPQFNLGICYALAVWLPIMALNLYKGRRLMLYLRDRHNDKWVELTTIPGFGFGHVNGFRSVPWLFSADTLADPVLANIKSEYRRFIYWVLTVFFTMPIFWIAFSI
jgi:hypothetical protein